MSGPFVKNFEQWNIVKQQIDALPGVPIFKAREIWWCSIGTNVGAEMCGKGANFSRPVLILKKTGGTTFIGVPATTSPTTRWDHHPVIIKGTSSQLLISGVRSLDARRLRSKIEKLPEAAFADVLSAIVGKIFSPAQ